MWRKPPRIPTRSVVGAQYFVYFGILGMFLPYFNLYYYHIGFSGFQIGTLSALRSLALVVFPICWGLLADRYRIRRQIYIFCNFASTGMWTCYLLTTDFWPVFVVTLVYGAFYAPIISFLEAFAMETLGPAREGYGSIRAWGSVSFIAVVIVLGRVIDAYSVVIILKTIMVGSAVLCLFSLQIPGVTVAPKGPLLPHARALVQPKVLGFLFCAFLMLVSHGTYYGFFSIHLEALGYDKTFVGTAWALASMAEILAMIRSRKIFGRFSLENVLIFSFMTAAVRWFSLYFAVSPAAILATQVLHAVTYGTFHMAGILYIDRLSSDHAKTLGQAANNAVTYGLGLMVGFLLNGWLYESLGAGVLFVCSGGIALLGGCLFMGLQRRQRQGTNHSFFR